MIKFSAVRFVIVTFTQSYINKAFRTCQNNFKFCFLYGSVDQLELFLPFFQVFKKFYCQLSVGTFRNVHILAAFYKLVFYHTDHKAQIKNMVVA